VSLPNSQVLAAATIRHTTRQRLKRPLDPEVM
jgi:hypothetical protein